MSARLKNLICMLLGVMLLPLAARADYGPPPAIIVGPPPHGCDHINVNVWTDRQSYTEGEHICINVRTNRNAHIYVFSTDASGCTRQIFPNYYDNNNFVRAHQVKRLPSGRYTLTAAGEGWERIHVIAVGADCSCWSPPSWGSRSSHGDPFPVYGGGYDSARAHIVGTIEAAHGGHGHGGGIRYSGSLSIKVGPPSCGKRIAWGEACTSIYIAAYCPPPPPDECYEPPYEHHYKPPYKPAHRTGRLEINSWPSYAQVHVNGEFCGSTPFRRDLPVGSHEIRVSKPGYETWCQTVYIEPGCRERITVRLKRAHVCTPRCRPGCKGW